MTSRSEPHDILVKVLEWSLCKRDDVPEQFGSVELRAILEQEARKLEERIMPVAQDELDTLVRTFIGGNFGRDPDADDMAELLRLAYVSTVQPILQEDYGADTRSLWSDLYDRGALRRHVCPDGEDCPNCTQRRREQYGVAPVSLIRAVDDLIADPLHQLAGTDPDKIHTRMLYFLATRPGAEPIWSLARLYGPFDGPDASYWDKERHGLHLVLHDSMGGHKALIQCGFRKLPNTDELSELQTTALTKLQPSFFSPDIARWNLLTLGPPASSLVPPGPPETQWTVITVDDVRDVLKQLPDARDPAVRAYQRYLDRLSAVWEAVHRASQNGALGIDGKYRRFLRDGNALATVELADRLCNGSV